MISARKLNANRANARASTGPRTAAGKENAARNALRHGLRSPISADPALSAEVEALAREIAGEGASQEQQVLATRVAEAQIDLKRIRRARHDLLTRAHSNNNYRSPRGCAKRLKILMRLTRTIGFDATIPEEFREQFRPLHGAEKSATILHCDYIPITDYCDFGRTKPNSKFSGEAKGLSHFTTLVTEATRRVG